MKKAFFFAVIAFTLLLTTKSAKADCDPACQQQLKDQIKQYTDKIVQLQGQANTLSNQIASFNAQIRLTELKVQQTEDQINLLAGRIDQLEVSLQDLNKAFSARAVATYKMSRADEPVYMLFSANDLGDAVSKFHYLRQIQDYDQTLLGRLQSAQDIYKTNKQQSEDLQKQLKTQEAQLNSQKTAKNQLLLVTQNDERNYQSLLDKAQAELEAIQSIIAGKGQETQVGPVHEGDGIATIIPGASACSSGGHLHFEVVQNGAHQNPAGYLIPKGIIWDDGPDGPFSFSGSWQWPLNDPIRITQGYGMTYYAATLRYYGGAPHTGIDMINDNGDLTVKAVRNGTLFRGGIACGGGTLRYVHVQQDSGLDTYYLHVNY